MRLGILLFVVALVAFAAPPAGFPSRGGGASSSVSPLTVNGYSQAAFVNRCLVASGVNDLNLGLSGSNPTVIGVNGSVPALATTNALTATQRHTITTGVGVYSAGIWPGASAISGLGYAAATDGGQAWGISMLTQWGVTTIGDFARQRILVGLRENYDGGLNCRLPSALPNSAYVGCEPGQSNLHACTNDGSGSATCTDLGASFPCGSNGALLNTYINATATNVTFSVSNVASGATATVTATSDLPTPTATLSYELMLCSDGGTAEAMNYSLLCVGNP